MRPFRFTGDCTRGNSQAMQSPHSCSSEKQPRIIYYGYMARITNANKVYEEKNVVDTIPELGRSQNDC